MNPKFISTDKDNPHPKGEKWQKQRKENGRNTKSKPNTDLDGIEQSLLGRIDGVGRGRGVVDDDVLLLLLLVVVVLVGRVIEAAGVMVAVIIGVVSGDGGVARLRLDAVRRRAGGVDLRANHDDDDESNHPSAMSL